MRLPGSIEIVLHNTGEHHPMSPFGVGTSAAAVLGELRTCWQGFLKDPDGVLVTAEPGPLPDGRYQWFRNAGGRMIRRLQPPCLCIQSLGACMQ